MGNLPQRTGAPPLTCGACGHAVYLDPKLAVACVVDMGGEVLLLRRAQRDQAYNRWILPGGHVDRGEPLERAAAREAVEETGLQVELGGLLGLYSYEGNPVVLAAYAARPVGGSLSPGIEALEMKCFAQGDIPWHDLGYPSTGDALRDFFKRRA